MKQWYRDCDTIGAEDGKFGIGVGEPCENEGIISFDMWWFCKECHKRLTIHRSGNGWGKRRNKRRDHE